MKSQMLPMLRKVIICLMIVLLSGCGNPSVVAYTRGIIIEKEADSERPDDGTLNNQAKAKYFQAIEQYNSAINLDPKHSQAYYRRGLCRAKLQQFDAAVGDFSQTLSMEPRNAKVWIDRGEAYQELRQWKKAVADFDVADRLLPEDQYIYSARAYCKLYSGDLQSALADAQKAVALKPIASNYSVLARIYRACGKKDEMEKTYQFALAANPHRVSTYQSRGFSRFLFGDYKQSLSDFQTALRASNWTGADTPYAVLFSYFCYRLRHQDNEASALLSEAMTKLSILGEIDKGAHNAQVSGTWPYPAIQYFHGHIRAEALRRAAGDDISKNTEAKFYLGLDSFLRGDKKNAQEDFDWVAKNGREDFIEYEAAQVFKARLSH